MMGNPNRERFFEYFSGGGNFFRQGKMSKGRQNKGKKIIGENKYGKTT